MKACSTLAVILGLVSSTAWAQAVHPSSGAAATQVSPSSERQSETVSSGSQSIGMQSSTEHSSGASASAMTQSGSGGQLITSEIVKAQPPVTAPVLVQAKTESGITYMCGGVGEDEASYIKTAASEYDVMMTFAAKTGNYLADVNVAITDARGRTVLETTCSGPMMLVDLPKSGTYRIQADANGHTIKRTVQAKNSGQASRVVFAWPASASGMERVVDVDRGRANKETSAGDSGITGASGRGESLPQDQQQNRSELSGSRSGFINGDKASEGSSSSGSGSQSERSGSNGSTGALGTGGNTSSPSTNSSTGATGSGTSYDSPTKGIR